MSDLQNLANPELWVVVLYAVGFSLVILEVFIPGWISGMAGIFSMGLAVYLAWTGVSRPFAALLAAGGVAGIPLIIRWGMNRMALQSALSSSAGFVAAEAGERSALVGKRGVAATVLRPSGAVEVEGKRYDARSERGVVDKGIAVEVTRVEGVELIVKGI